MVEESIKLLINLNEEMKNIFRPKAHKKNELLQLSFKTRSSFWFIDTIEGVFVYLKNAYNTCFQFLIDNHMEVKQNSSLITRYLEDVKNHLYLIHDNKTSRITRQNDKRNLKIVLKFLSYGVSNLISYLEQTISHLETLTNAANELKLEVQYKQEIITMSHQGFMLQLNMVLLNLSLLDKANINFISFIKKVKINANQLLLHFDYIRSSLKSESGRYANREESSSAIEVTSAMILVLKELKDFDIPEYL